VMHLLIEKLAIGAIFILQAIPPPKFDASIN
jgi:hypothetical protein